LTTYPQLTPFLIGQACSTSAVLVPKERKDMANGDLHDQIERLDRHDRSFSFITEFPHQ